MRNSTEKLVKDIRRHTRKKYSAEEKIRNDLEGLRGEDSIAELCSRKISIKCVFHSSTYEQFLSLILLS